VRVGEKQWWHEESGAAHGPDDNDAYYLAEVCQGDLLSVLGQQGTLACVDVIASCASGQDVSLCIMRIVFLCRLDKRQMRSRGKARSATEKKTYHRSKANQRRGRRQHRRQNVHRPPLEE